jgi:S-adenosylmethionine hydrolase
MPVAYFGSTGQLEIAVNNGDAARRFGMNQNSTIIIHPD